MQSLRSVLYYLGFVLVAFSVLQAAPLAVSVLYDETVEFPMRIYAIPAAISLVVGLALVLSLKPRPMTPRLSMAVGTLGWFALSLLGAVPFRLALDISYLDAFCEAVSGFTTTGATYLTGLQWLPKSLLFWRALTQWIGGLGIFTLFLLVVRESGARRALMDAETHKAPSERFSPGVFSSLRILWGIYGGLTAACGLLLWAEGMRPFDALAHALTTLSTGGFSTYDASVGHFAAIGAPHAVAIEYTILFFMFLGGTSFLILWNLLRRRWRSVAGNMELKLWIGLLIAATGLVVFADRGNAGLVGWHAHIRGSLFHVVSIATTSGFTLRGLPTSWFSDASRQVLLLMMLIGGCVGSTAGGLKVFRVAVLGSTLRHSLRASLGSALLIFPRQLGRRRLQSAELDRVVAVTVGWGACLIVGWMAVALASRLDAWASLSGIVSAVGNIGPHYIPDAADAQLGPAVRLLFALGMVAGRLEILPVLILFSRKTWR